MIRKASRQSYKDPRETHRELAMQKKKMLEASVFALQEGDGLIASLQDAMASNPLASMAIASFRISLCRSVEIVELWMETIYTNRVAVTKQLQENHQSQLSHWATVIRFIHK